MASADTFDRIRLIGPKSDQLGPIHHCLLDDSQCHELFQRF